MWPVQRGGQIFILLISVRPQNVRFYCLGELHRENSLQYARAGAHVTDACLQKPCVFVVRPLAPGHAQLSNDPSNLAPRALIRSATAQELGGPARYWVGDHKNGKHSSIQQTKLSTRQQRLN